MADGVRDVTQFVNGVTRIMVWHSQPLEEVLPSVVLSGLRLWGRQPSAADLDAVSDPASDEYQKSPNEASMEQASETAAIEDLPK